MLLEQLNKEGFRRGMSPRTIDTYCFCIRKFLRTCRKELKYITKKDVENYLDQFVERGDSGNTLNVHLNALKFFFEKVLKRRLTVNVVFSKAPKRLPEFLTKEETSRLLEAIINRKHKLMATLLYAAGMRVSELASLKVRDFEFDLNYGWVRQGKGKKDRLFVVAQKLKQELLSWIAENKLNSDDWLFPGQYSESHVSTSTVQLIIKICFFHRCVHRW